MLAVILRLSARNLALFLWIYVFCIFPSFWKSNFSLRFTCWLRCLPGFQVCWLSSVAASHLPASAVVIDKPHVLLRLLGSVLLSIVGLLSFWVMNHIVRCFSSNFKNELYTASTIVLFSRSLVPYWWGAPYMGLLSSWLPHSGWFALWFVVTFLRCVEI